MAQFEAYIRDEYSVENYYEEGEAEQKLNDILAGNNPYENGELGKTTVELDVTDGVVSLAEGVYFHYGQ
jgi:hypothetical protein